MKSISVLSLLGLAGVAATAVGLPLHWPVLACFAAMASTFIVLIGATDYQRPRRYRMVAIPAGKHRERMPLAA